jgi:glutaredoxin
MAKKVYLYVDPGSSVCYKAKSYLWEKGVPFVELDLRKDPAARRSLAKLGINYTPGLPFNPVFDIDGQIIAGIDLYRLERALADQGGTSWDPKNKQWA